MFQIKMYGLGGQGVVTAAQVLSHAAGIREGKYAKIIPAYGHERRGAPVSADVMIADEYILLSCFVYNPDFVVVFDASVLDAGVHIEKGIHPGTVLIMNASHEALAKGLKDQYGFDWVYYVDASRVALAQLGVEILNSAMLGACARSDIVKVESITGTLREFFKDRSGEKNVRAARIAFNETRKL